MNRSISSLVLLISLTAFMGQLAWGHERNTLVPEGHDYYHPSPIPDRVILMLTPTPYQSQTVNWRTNDRVDRSLAQITKAGPTPGLHLQAELVEGQLMAVSSQNGSAHYHSVSFENLEAETLYAYRVMGDDTWSEWFQFQTASKQTKPFTFFYFGDAQNSVRSHFSRVIREAFMRNHRPAFMLHAGDMVNLREGNHDDEWGEWFDAGSFLNAMIPSIIVAGNHEFVDQLFRLKRTLSPQFEPQFTIPQNGPEGLQKTVYYVSYQGALIVVLDSMSALYDDADAIKQAEWLDELLAHNNHRWLIVSHHHPIHSVSAGRDNEVLREHWLPLYEKHGVDLVLQGHDHSYGRGQTAQAPETLIASDSGPVYVVSVAGPKMYGIGDEDNPHMTRMAEELQLYQTISVGHDKIKFEARSADGSLYDAFEILKDAEGNTTVNELLPDGQPTHRCTNPHPVSRSRCWDGKELISLPEK